MNERATRVLLVHHHDDATWSKNVEKYLAPLKRDNFITIDALHKIGFGLDVHSQTIEKVREADVVLFLITAELLDDNTMILAAEVAAAHQQYGLTIIPVLVKSCLWSYLPIAGLKPFPDGERTLDGEKSHSDLLTKLAQEVRRVVMERPGSTEAPPPDEDLSRVIELSALIGRHQVSVEDIGKAARGLRGQPSLEVGSFVYFDRKPRFRLLHEVTQGESKRLTRVWHAYDELFQTPVVLKVLDATSDTRAAAATTSNAYGRFHRCASLRQEPGDHLVRIIAGPHQERGLHYYAMPHLPRGSLAFIVNSTSALASLSFEQKISLLRQICGAIDHLHDRGFVHRAITAESILVDESYNAFLGGFDALQLLRSNENTTMFSSFDKGTFGDPSMFDGTGSRADQRLDFEAIVRVAAQLFSSPEHTKIIAAFIPRARSGGIAFARDFADELEQVIRAGKASSDSLRSSTASRTSPSLDVARADAVSGTPPPAPSRPLVAETKPVALVAPERVIAPPAAAPRPGKPFSSRTKLLLGLVTLAASALGVTFAIHGSRHGGPNGGPTSIPITPSPPEPTASVPSATVVPTPPPPPTPLTVVCRTVGDVKDVLATPMVNEIRSIRVKNSERVILAGAINHFEEPDGGPWIGAQKKPGGNAVSYDELTVGSTEIDASLDSQSNLQIPQLKYEKWLQGTTHLALAAAGGAGVVLLYDTSGADVRALQPNILDAGDLRFPDISSSTPIDTDAKDANSVVSGLVAGSDVVVWFTRSKLLQEDRYDASRIYFATYSGNGFQKARSVELATTDIKTIVLDTKRVWIAVSGSYKGNGIPTIYSPLCDGAIKYIDLSCVRDQHCKPLLKDLPLKENGQTQTRFRPMGLAVDDEQSMIYWADGCQSRSDKGLQNFRIYATRFDGSTIQVAEENGFSEKFGIPMAISDWQLYWGQQRSSNGLTQSYLRTRKIKCSLE